MSGVSSQKVMTVLVGLVVMCLSVRAQDVKQSEREAMYARYLAFPSYVKGGSVQPHWMADGSSFWYVEGAPTNTSIWKVDPATNAKTSLFDSLRVRKALTPVLGHEPPDQGLPFSDFTWLGEEKAVRFTVESKDFILQLDTYAVAPTPAQSDQDKSLVTPQVTRRDPYGYWADELEVVSPDRRWFVGVIDHNIWLRSTNDNRRVPMTTDGVKDDEWHQGYPSMPPTWSPDSLKLAANKLDFRGTPRIAVTHYVKQPEDVDFVYYPKAGERRAESALYIVDVPSKRQLRVDVGEEPGPRPLLWRPDGSELLFLKTARYGRKVELKAADPSTGSTRLILAETDPIGVSVPFRQPASMITLLADSKRFIWMAARDGWAHLYLYNLDGTLVRRLTEGPFPVVRVIAVDESAGWIYFIAQPDLLRPYDTHLCRVSLEGEHFQRLTEASGQHDIRFAPSKAFFLDVHSTVSRPPVVELRRADGQLRQTISRADVSALTGELRWKAPEEIEVTAADGKTALYGVIYKPYDFDATKSYPVLETFAAPRTFYPPEGYGAIPMAQLGYVVVTLDGRGTDGRGKTFADADFGQIGRWQIADQVAALRELAETRPYLDLSRVGVLSGSYPGFLAIRAMLVAPDVYRVGVAVDAITDLAAHWRNEGMLGPPATNQQGYEYASNLPLAGNLKGKLLLIHGTSDIDVPISHTMTMVEALVRAGKPYDLLVLPEQPHIARGISWVYMRDAIRRYFQEHLKP